MKKSLLMLTAILALTASVGCSKKKDSNNKTGNGGNCSAGYIYVSDYRILQVLGGSANNTFCMQNPQHPNCYGQNTGNLQPRCVTSQEYQYALQQTGGGGNTGGGAYHDYCSYWAQQGYNYNQCISYCTSTGGALCY